MPYRKFNYDEWQIVHEMRPSDLLQYSPKGQDDDLYYDKIGRSTKLFRVIEEGMYGIKKEDYDDKGNLKEQIASSSHNENSVVFQQSDNKGSKIGPEEVDF